MPGTEVWKCASTAMRPCVGQLHADLVEAEPFDERPPADADQHDIGLHGLGRAAFGRLDASSVTPAPVVSALVTLRAQLELQPLLGERALELLGDLVVDARRDAVEELDHRHLRAEPPPHRAQLEPDDAGADHDQVLGHLGELERAGRRDDLLLVDGDAGQRRHLRARGDQDVLGRQRVLDRAVVAQDRRPSPPCRCGRCPGTR